MPKIVIKYKKYATKGLVMKYKYATITVLIIASTALIAAQSNIDDAHNSSLNEVVTDYNLLISGEQQQNSLGEEVNIVSLEGDLTLPDSTFSAEVDSELREQDVYFTVDINEEESDFGTPSLNEIEVSENVQVDTEQVDTYVELSIDGEDEAVIREREVVFDSDSEQEDEEWDLPDVEESEESSNESSEERTGQSGRVLDDYDLEFQESSGPDNAVNLDGVLSLATPQYETEIETSSEGRNLEYVINLVDESDEDSIHQPVISDEEVSAEQSTSYNNVIATANVVKNGETLATHEEELDFSEESTRESYREDEETSDAENRGEFEDRSREELIEEIRELRAELEELENQNLETDRESDTGPNGDESSHQAPDSPEHSTSQESSQDPDLELQEGQSDESAQTEESSGIVGSIFGAFR